MTDSRGFSPHSMLPQARRQLAQYLFRAYYSTWRQICKGENLRNGKESVTNKSACDTIINTVPMDGQRAGRFAFRKVGDGAMSEYAFSIFPNDNFLDFRLFQYGWEQCEPLYSFGPYVRNHYLFHYVISGRGGLVSNDENGESRRYQLEPGQGFLICPGLVNTYTADEQQPWKYVWLEFDGLRLTQAAEQKRGTNDPIGDIARRCGYPNRLHFSQAFKKRYGLPPREWGKENKPVTR